MDFDRSEVMACAGAKQALFNALMATLDPGDEVILPTPCWLSYFDIVNIAGGVPVMVKGSFESGYKITPEQLQKAITPRSRWIWFNSPNNPSGAVYSQSELAALLAVIEKHPHLWVIADDVYEHIRFNDQEFATPAAVRPDLKDRILTINAVSKAFAMTGWRPGYCGGPADLISAMSIVQSQSTTNPSSISQAAAIAALTGSQEFLRTAQQIYKQRRKILYDGLASIDGIEGAAPEGSFFAFVRASKLMGTKTPDGTSIKDDKTLCSFLLETANVVVVPGSEFRLPDHLRISFALPDEEIVIALQRLQSSIDTLVHS